MKVLDILYIAGWMGFFIGYCLIVINWFKTPSLNRKKKILLSIAAIVLAIIMVIWPKTLPRIAGNKEASNREIVERTVIDLSTGEKKRVNIDNIPVSERRYYREMAIPYSITFPGGKKKNYRGICIVYIKNTPIGNFPE